MAAPAAEPAPATAATPSPRTARSVNTTTKPPAGEKGQVRSYFVGRRWTGVTNPAKLSISKLRDMEKDPQVQAGVRIRELAILGKPGTVTITPKNKDDAAERALRKLQAEFLEWNIRNLTPRWTQVMRNIMSARRFGFSINEIVWASTTNEEGAVELAPCTQAGFEGLFYIQKIKLLPPESIANSGLDVDEKGRIVGVFQSFFQAPTAAQTPRDRAVAPTGPSYPRIEFRGPDMDRLVIYSANPDSGNPYGNSDHVAAYNPWYSKQAATFGADVLLERSAGVIVAEDPNALENSKLGEVLDSAAPGAVLIVPPGAAPHILEGSDNVLQAFHERIRLCDIQILRAYLVPNETVGGDGGDVGANARANSHFQSFLLGARQLQLELEEVIESILRQLIIVNWGPQDVYPTYDFPELQNKDMQSLAQVFESGIRNGYIDPAFDAPWIRQALDIQSEPPEGYQFTKPAPAAAPQMGAGPFGFPLPASLQQEAQKPDAPTRVNVQAELAGQPTNAFQVVDSPAQNDLTLSMHEAAARADIARAAGDALTHVLADLPKDGSAAELARLNIPDEWIRSVLDQVAADVLARVRLDLAGKFRALERADIADAITQETTVRAQRTLGNRIRAFLRADDAPTDLSSLELALRSYTEWASSLNQLTSQRSANELTHRLRLRILQAYAQEMTMGEIARSVADEFSTYTSQQLDTVARTTVMDYYNSARNASYDAAGDYVQGVRFVPLLDASTTPFCRDLVGRSIARTDPNYERVRNPPFWYNCRTTVIPILSGETWTFNDDWPTWIIEHASAPGGGFLYGRTA